MNHTTFPAAALLSAFADELIEPDDWRSRGAKLPGQEKKVKAAPLAAHVVAFSLWRLAADGVISLRYDERKRLGLFTTCTVTARLARPVPPRAARTEQMLLDQLAAGGERTVDDLVYAALGEDSSHPAGVVIHLAHRDGVTSGLFEEVSSGRGAVGRALLGATQICPVEDALPLAKAQFADLLAQWRAFQAGDPVLAEHLVGTCDKGITRRIESDHDSD